MLGSIADLLKVGTLLQPGPGAAAYHRLFEVREETGRSLCPPQLATKYSVPEDGTQQIIAVTNRVTRQMTFFNKRRTVKPITFEAVRPTDPTLEKGCDFCRWQQLTAADAFEAPPGGPSGGPQGVRFENEHAVSASNLFKICGAHGVVLFKHHDPLAFSEAQLGGLLDCSAQWLEAAAAGNPPNERFPALMWNCGSRAGASQFHGHAQVMMNRSPLPEEWRLASATAAYSARAGSAYVTDAVLAHRALGLVTDVAAAAPAAEADEGAVVFPTIAPWKDCELLVVGRSVRSRAFRRALHAAMRGLVDGLGVTAFNVAIFGLPRPGGGGLAGEGEWTGGSAVARVVSRGSSAAKSSTSDFGALEVLYGASIGHTDPWLVRDAIRARLGRRADEAPAGVAGS